MPKQANLPAELKNLGAHLANARTRQGLTQKELALRCGIFQPRVSAIERGELLPTLPQLIRLAHALDLPLQWFLDGFPVPGAEEADLAIQLRWMGIADLFVPEAVVPGAFRPVEQVFAMTVRGEQPNPRIIEALPALLAWNQWSATRLRDYARPRESKACIRLAWLADVALTIERTTKFPGGCPARKRLETFVGKLSRAKLDLKDDDLGRPAADGNVPPVSKRWKINYAAPLSAFTDRAAHLNSLREQQRSRGKTPKEASDE